VSSGNTVDCGLPPLQTNGAALVIV